jgi:hypothetical protein
MAANYVLLERIELNASAASVTFSNIPQSGYTDLKVVMSIRGDASQILLKIQPNGDTTGLSRRSLYTDTGTAAYSGSGSDAFAGYIETSAYTANTFASLEAYFPNYTSSNAKSYSVDVVGENNATATIMGMIAGLDTTTSPITSLVFTPNSGNFVQYSTFSLYGLAAVGTTPAIAPKASGGNITTDGTYWYHTFLTTGAFVPATNLTCDALVVAGGGGGGGGQVGGGGGGGGVTYYSSQSLSATGYTCTVGAGGAGQTGYTSSGTSGANSQFASLTASVGGGGGGYGGTSGAVNGLSGGSGGGAGGDYGTSNSHSGGTATSGQGYAGGITNTPSNAGGAGGGGAGGVGGNNSGTNGRIGGNGGVGISTYSSWGVATGVGQNVSGTYYLAGGAGGRGGDANGSGGYGGGATSSVAGQQGQSGTGGGGAPHETGETASNGGSGIVIIRYTIA